MEREAFDKPDETRPFKDGKRKVDVVTVGEHTVGRGTFEPGWRWSEHVKPIAGTASCQAAHTGYVLEGRMVVKMDDGTSTARVIHSMCRPVMTPGSLVIDAAC
jgi:hypothetical protein